MKLTLVFCGLLCAVTAIPGMPSTDPSAYDLRYRIPTGCDPTTDCTYFVGLEVNANNPSYLDVFLTAPVAGWVAVGFSPTPSMPDSDVFGCIVRDSEVEAIDTYNVPTGARNNRLDPEQGDIVFSTGTLENGRITCTFSRLIAGDQAPSVDRNLNNSFFLLSGFNINGRTAENAGFSVHRFTPGDLPRALATEMVNPVMAEGELPLMMEPTDECPTDVPSPVIDPQDYRLRRRDPAGCDPQDCDFFMGINNNTNPEYLDFYMTADIGGWVAVGFSPSANMFDADVVGCNVDSTNGDVAVVDTSNPVSGRANNLDITRDVCRHSSSFVNGRITCIFSRKVVGTDATPMDRPLNSDYYFLFGVGRSGGGSGCFPNHQPLIPPISGSQFNPLKDSGGIASTSRSLYNAQWQQLVHALCLLCQLFHLAVTVW
ncbi:DOMON domain-containing protein FRRS1L [Geodia barretti]|uniref:DOMON domain-containing protein FRRS1L n=2 Tax=Geodia barretti TaxID=519541 RepID=A0AA35SW77_GEOBA|nr:DOMON domain-containing protein FRRS1L [Geodia barretti]